MATATVEAICISGKKGIVKREIEEVLFENDWGIEKDAHVGKWHRQVSLLAGESIDRVKEKLPTLKNGAFAENIITRNIDLTRISNPLPGNQIPRVPVSSPCIPVSWLTKWQMSFIAILFYRFCFC